jgi:hypothetical protein
MSKTITSPVKKWPGTVTLSDPLSYPQYFAFEDAMKAAGDLDKDNTTLMRYNFTMLLGVCPCVEKWELKGLPTVITPDSGYPTSPVRASQELSAWLIGEVVALFREAEEIPNE